MRELRTLLKRVVLVALLAVAFVAPASAAVVYDGIYILDGYGNVHTLDNAPVITTGVNAGFDNSRALALIGNETGEVDGMYILDGYGDVFAHPEGGNTPEYPGVYRPMWGWDIARDVEPIMDWSVKKNGIAGFYILDGFGGVFPVGDMSKPFVKVYRSVQSLEAGEDRYLYWGWDVAVDIEVAPIYDESYDFLNAGANSSSSGNTGALRGTGYYILDKFGGVHWNLEDENGNVVRAPWYQTSPQPYFGWDIARSFKLTTSGKGYFLLDGYGGLHAVGDAKAAGFLPPSGSTPPYTLDIAKDLQPVFDETGYTKGMFVMNGYGQILEYGQANVVNPMPLFKDENGDLWDIAKDMEVSPFFNFVSEAVVTGP